MTAEEYLNSAVDEVQKNAPMDFLGRTIKSSGDTGAWSWMIFGGECKPVRLSLCRWCCARITPRFVAEE